MAPPEVRLALVRYPPGRAIHFVTAVDPVHAPIWRGRRALCGLRGDSAVDIDPFSPQCEGCEARVNHMLDDAPPEVRRLLGLAPVPAPRPA